MSSPKLIDGIDPDHLELEDDDDFLERTGEIPVRYIANSIDQHSRSHIEKVVRYILSDGKIYTNDQIVEEAARYWLGLSKLTQRARRTIESEIERVKRS
jgi:hypothetical protein